MSIIPAGHTRVAIDTAPLIYFLNGDEVRAPLVRPVLAASAAREIDLVVSVVTEAELLIAPLRSGDDRTVSVVSRLLDGPADISVAPVGREIGRLAAHIRSEIGLRLADALIAATAISSGCTALLGNDEKLRRLGDRIEYLHLDDHTAVSCCNS